MERSSVAGCLIVGALSTAGLVLALGGGSWISHQPGAVCKPDQAIPTGYARIGGPFDLTDQNGRRVAARDLLGKPTLVFFGYTYWPEVCPTTLLRISDWLVALGADANRLNVVFITVDPQRDTPRQLHDYLLSFDPRIRGLTGTQQEIGHVANEYGVFYKKETLPGGSYDVQHSTVIYIMDAKGRYTGPISYQEPPDNVIPMLRDLARG